MDKRQGYGTFIYKNGTKYEGPWLNNVQHGKGIKIDPYGLTDEVYFINGK